MDIGVPEKLHHDLIIVFFPIQIAQGQLAEFLAPQGADFGEASRLNVR